MKLSSDGSCRGRDEVALWKSFLMIVNIFYIRVTGGLTLLDFFMIVNISIRISSKNSKSLEYLRYHEDIGRSMAQYW